MFVEDRHSSFIYKIVTVSKHEATVLRHLIIERLFITNRYIANIFKLEGR